ncbi:MAG: hypothetical protein LBR78_01305 [Holosporales bacterium]|jgi:hypothetical protein|nr:hypothetical protein [Holosporales bacterium]
MKKIRLVLVTICTVAICADGHAMRRVRGRGAQHAVGKRISHTGNQGALDQFIDALGKAADIKYARTAAQVVTLGQLLQSDSLNELWADLRDSDSFNGYEVPKAGVAATGAQARTGKQMIRSRYAPGRIATELIELYDPLAAQKIGPNGDGANTQTFTEAVEQSRGRRPFTEHIANDLVVGALLTKGEMAELQRLEDRRHPGEVAIRFLDRLAGMLRRAHGYAANRAAANVTGNKLSKLYDRYKDGATVRGGAIPLYHWMPGDRGEREVARQRETLREPQNWEKLPIPWNPTVLTLVLQNEGTKQKLIESATKYIFKISGTEEADLQDTVSKAVDAILMDACHGNDSGMMAILNGTIPLTAYSTIERLGHTLASVMYRAVRHRVSAPSSWKAKAGEQGARMEAWGIPTLADKVMAVARASGRGFDSLGKYDIPGAIDDRYVQAQVEALMAALASASEHQTKLTLDSVDTLRRQASEIERHTHEMRRRLQDGTSTGRKYVEASKEIAIRTVVAEAFKLEVPEGSRESEELPEDVLATLSRLVEQYLMAVESAQALVSNKVGVHQIDAESDQALRGVVRDLPESLILLDRRLQLKLFALAVGEKENGEWARGHMHRTQMHPALITLSDEKLIVRDIAEIPEAELLYRQIRMLESLGQGKIPADVYHTIKRAISYQYGRPREAIDSVVSNGAEALGSALNEYIEQLSKEYVEDDLMVIPMFRGLAQMVGFTEERAQEEARILHRAGTRQTRGELLIDLILWAPRIMQRLEGTPVMLPWTLTEEVRFKLTPPRMKLVRLMTEREAAIDFFDTYAGGAKNVEQAIAYYHNVPIATRATLGDAPVAEPPSTAPKEGDPDREAKELAAQAEQLSSISEQQRESMLAQATEASLQRQAHLVPFTHLVLFEGVSDKLAEKGKLPQERAAVVIPIIDKLLERLAQEKSKDAQRNVTLLEGIRKQARKVRKTGDEGVLAGLQDAIDEMYKEERKKTRPAKAHKPASPPPQVDDDKSSSPVSDAEPASVSPPVDEGKSAPPKGADDSGDEDAEPARKRKASTRDSEDAKPRKKSARTEEAREEGSLPPPHSDSDDEAASPPPPPEDFTEEEEEPQ